MAINIRDIGIASLTHLIGHTNNGQGGKLTVASITSSIQNALEIYVNNALSGISTTINGKANITRTVSSQNGATYTLTSANNGNIVRMTLGTAKTLTIPTNAAIAFAIGTQVDVVCIGGNLTIAGSSGVTLNSDSLTVTNGRKVTLLKVATNEWDVLSG